MPIRIFGMLMLAIALLSACQRDQGVAKQDVEAVLRENPELILRVLRENKEDVFDIVQAGLESKRKQQEMAKRQQELQNPKQPAIAPDRPVRGDEDAPVTIVEYSDFLCPYCLRGAATVEQVLEEYAGEVRLVFKHQPLKSHEHAMIAARYFEATAMQDEQKAWQLHDRMFAQQEALEKGGEPWLKNVVAQLGLDVEQIARDARSDEVTGRIESDMAEARQFGFRGTPYFLVGGVSIAGAVPPEDFKDVVELVLAHKEQQDTAGQ